MNPNTIIRWIVIIIMCISLSMLFTWIWFSSCRADTIPGDVNQSGSVNIADVMTLVDYIFNGVSLPRTEWVEVDTTVSVVWILDRPFTIREWPIKAQNHFYVTTRTQYDTIEVLGWGDTVLLIDSTTIVDTTVIREYKITEATYPSGNELIRTR